MFKLGDLFAQNLRDSIPAIKEKLERLTDAYLAEALELAEYQERKNTLMAEKKTIEEKLSDFERKGNHWLEPPTFGGNSFGGIQNPLEFLGGNQCRGAKPRGNFFNKFGMVDPGGIEPPYEERVRPRLQG